MNRQRKADETFEDYRLSQNREQDRIKQRLEGKYVHVSKTHPKVPGNTRVGSFKDV